MFKYLIGQTGLNMNLFKHALMTNITVRIRCKNLTEGTHN